MSQLREQRRDASTSRMLSAARREFTLRGYSGARIENMARDAGVSKGLFSQRFTSREQLFFALYREQLSLFSEIENSDEPFSVVMHDITCLASSYAESSPEGFAFIRRFISSDDIPASCMDDYRSWFSGTRICRLVQEQIIDGIILEQDAFSVFFKGLKLLFGVAGSFLDAGLPIPDGDSLAETISRSFSSSPVPERLEDRATKDALTVLASDYNAVYFCNADNHSYDILYQQGFVREELLAMLRAIPKFENAFEYYINSFVFPDDRPMMRRQLLSVTKKLEKSKGFKVEFRRSYGGEFRYTEMNCVKVDAPDEPLHTFVVGFLENDAQYRNLIDRQNQLEAAVIERTADLTDRNLALNRINEDIIELLGNITEARDVESGEHIRRVKGLTNILATRLMELYPEYGLTKGRIELMTSASALHDIGKIMIPDSVLLKPGRLTPEEFALMKTHCEKGYEILRKAPADWSDAYLSISLDICRYHHEKYDGKGYPYGLKGEEIPVVAQIVSLADCFDALTAKRVYKNAFTPVKAYQMIMAGECGAFSEKLLNAFTSSFADLVNHLTNTSSEFRSSIPAGISTSSLSWTKLLIVDDNDLGLEMTKDILEGEGAEVTAVPGGQEAIDTFAASEPGYFDAIVMDIIMPEPDGVKAAQAIRSLPREDAHSVPIIALSSLSSESEINRCLDAGMDSFITRPIVISSFIKVLYECLQSRSEALTVAVKNASARADRHMADVINTNPMLAGFSADCDLIFYTSSSANDITSLQCSPEIEALYSTISPRLPSNRRLDVLFQKIVPANAFTRFLEDVDRTKIVSYLDSHPFYSAFFPAVIGGVERSYILRVIKDNDSQGGFIMALKSTDSETENEFRSRELIKLLTDAYEVVDYVDLEADTYIRYASSPKTTDSVGSHGCYSAHLAKYVSTWVHKEDRGFMSVGIVPENIAAQLDTRKQTSIRFRDTRFNPPRYYELQYIKADESGSCRHVILTLSDVDDIVKKEKSAAL